MRPVKARTVLLLWLVLYFPWLPGFPLRQWSWIPSVPEKFVIDANQAGEWALIAFSLVLLTGWVGQISLGQGSFVGVGAFTAGLLSRRLGIPFPLSLPIIALIGAGVAALLGTVALRVRGLYLAVATLIFAWMADAYLFSASWFVGEAATSSVERRPIGLENSITRFDFTNKRVFYLVMVAAVAAAWYALINLRDSKTGRAFFAVRGSEMAAVSLGIDVSRYKLLAFAISGGLAAVAGNLLITDVGTAVPQVFNFTQSLFFLSIAVVGGISSLGGALAAAILFSGLSEAYSYSSFLASWKDIVPIALLLVVLLGYPGGLAAAGETITRRATGMTDRLTARVKGLRGRRSKPPESDAEDALEAAPVEEEKRTVTAAEEILAPGLLASLVRAVVRRVRRPRRTVVRRAIDLSRMADTVLAPVVEEIVAAQTAQWDWRDVDSKGFLLPADRADREPVLVGENITVQFGGLTAVDNVSLEVRQHEIVGLIGPNGAGKTTTFNALAGLNEPTSGRVHIFGEDATSYPVHIRAQMGVGRTFQLIQLFSQLTVFDNLLVATHVHNDTGVFSHIALTGRAVEAEYAARQQARLVLSLLGLEEVADRRVAGLPFGILRQVEIARALVTKAPFLMLDEPASGLDNAETDELARLLYFVRAELGVSILLIEHDVRMVTSVSDYMYVLNRGKLLAEGTPGDVQRNPDVIAAYLGQAEPVAEEVGAG